jgi:pyrroloquinoline quinone biosynthesis protein D
MTQPGARIVVEPGSKPALVRSVKLRFDDTRKIWVLLAPERLLTPSETAVAVLQHCDGHRTVLEIARLLAEEFDAPPEAIIEDILPLLQDLADRRFLSG